MGTGKRASSPAAAGEVVMWHNPKCSKSRQTLELLRARGVEPKVREYLKSPPSVAELERVLAMLGMEPRQLMRTKEGAYRELGLDDPKASRQALLRAMHDNPVLIERPVVMRQKAAVLGRPPENVEGLF